MPKPKRDASHTDPFSTPVREAERLVLAARSPRAAHVGTEDSSLGDLILALIGRSSRETLELIGIELAFAERALGSDCRAPLELQAERYANLLARRAAVAAELHRRIRVARSDRRR